MLAAMSLSTRTGLLLSRMALRNCCAPKIQADVRTIKRWVAPTLKELKRRRDKVGPEPPQPRSSYLEWNHDKEVFAFGQRLGEKFDKDLLVRALTHRSYSIAKTPDAPVVESNQDLIEEGHKIINDCLRQEFRKDYPQDVVEALVEYLTSDDMLAHVGKHMGLTDIILTAEFPVEKPTMADTFRAIIAALKQSSPSMERCELFIKDFLVCQLSDKDIFDIYKPDKPLEYLGQLLKDVEIEPRLCHKSAVNTILANFQVGLYSKSDKRLLGIGWGESIDNAKETAALDAIHRIHKEHHKIYKQY